LATNRTETTQTYKRKGELTRAAIVGMALELASRDGLEGVTIGMLADKMNMSKSGVFAHFGSREDLQLEVLKLYHHQFAQEVFYPSLKEQRGPSPPSGDVQQMDTPRYRRDCIWLHIYQWRRGIRRSSGRDTRCTCRHGLRMAGSAASFASGWLSSAGICGGDTDPQQMVFEMYGIILALHHDARFVQRAGSAERAQVSFRTIAAKLCKSDAVVEQDCSQPESKSAVNNSSIHTPSEEKSWANTSHRLRDMQFVMHELLPRGR